MSALGGWASSEEEMLKIKHAFQTAEPFPNAVIDGFLSDDVAKAIASCFPRPHTSGPTSAKWFVYNNPIECKFASTDLEKSPAPIQEYFATVQSPEFVHLIRSITGIPDLENDPHLHGAGIHFHGTGGKLDMHLDYSIHPISGKERRVNLILYINDEWNEDWGGDLFLGDSNEDGSLNSLAKKVAPRFNRGVLFRTSDISWHGLPFPITCPPGQGRQSLAIYYVSEPRTEATPRLKALFVGVPGKEEDEGMAELRRIRPVRRLTADDVARYAPEWTSAMASYLKTCPKEALIA